MLQVLAAALPSLVLLYWVLATGAATIALFPLPFASSFRSAVLLSACRGKLMDLKPPAALGPLSDWEVPQRWFAHFYALGSAWNAAIALLFLASPYYQSLPTEAKATNQLALALLQLHLVRRLAETVVLMKYPPRARMHGVAYLFGLSYYLVVPLTVLPGAAYASTAAALPSVKGSGTGLGAGLLAPAQIAGSLAPVQWAGVVVFLVGNALQLHSHLLLARLAGSAKRSAPVYRVPRGGAFALVSCPHYLAEIVIYLGLALLAGTGNPGPWLMVAWVVANLLLAGGLTHSWYKQRFKTYPEERRALIPYIY